MEDICIFLFVCIYIVYVYMYMLCLCVLSLNVCFAICMCGRLVRWFGSAFKTISDDDATDSEVRGQSRYTS